jgi:hypothetical protein
MIHKHQTWKENHVLSNLASPNPRHPVTYADRISGLLDTAPDKFCKVHPENLVPALFNMMARNDFAQFKPVYSAVQPEGSASRKNCCITFNQQLPEQLQDMIAARDSTQQKVLLDQLSDYPAIAKHLPTALSAVFARYLDSEWSPYDTKRSSAETLLKTLCERPNDLKTIRPALLGRMATRIVSETQYQDHAFSLLKQAAKLHPAHAKAIQKGAGQGIDILKAQFTGPDREARINCAIRFETDIAECVPKTKALVVQLKHTSQTRPYGMAAAQ